MWLVYLVIIFINSVEPVKMKQPVYKIALTQKGFPQYLEYDIDTSPIREFTLCVWLRVFEFSDEQTIFTYKVHGNNQIMRLWIEKEGKLIKISIKDDALSSFAVDLTQDTWHHICLSYQSDFGAWALYFNGRLVSCEAAPSILRYKLPAGGQFTFGHGSSRKGSPNGLEGEIYGVNVLLISAIEKNYSLNRNYYSKEHNISKDTDTHNADVHKFKLDASDQKYKDPRNFIKFNTPFSHLEYDIGIDLSPYMNDINITKVDNFIKPKYKKYSHTDTIKLWEMLSKNKHTEQFGANTKELPTISEYETPPPTPVKLTKDIEEPINSMLDGMNLDYSRNSIRKNTHQNYIPAIETPPPVEKKKEVYGQWTTSSFAKDVLNYLKSINGVTSRRKVPETIPLSKISDQFPYPSDLFPLNIVAPEEIHKRYFIQRHHPIIKRESNKPEVNVKILENDIRSFILQEHAKTYPQNVEITNRGKNTIDKEHRFHRNIRTYSSEITSASNVDKSKTLANLSKKNNEIGKWQQEFYTNLIHILPYSREFFTSVDNVGKNKMIQKNEMYTNSLSNESKRHNIKYHSDLFSPRDTKYVFKEVNQNRDIKPLIKHSNKLNKFLGLTNIDTNQNHANNLVDKDFLHETGISKLSSPFNMALLINNGNALFADQTAKAVNTFLNKSENIKNKFNQHVKIGNALNERYIIGNNGEKNKQSFVGGNENIPDIQRYRSDIDLTTDDIPPSLIPKVCKEVKQFDHLYNNYNDSGDILLMRESKNHGIYFIAAMYTCKEHEVILEKHNYFLINWSETPVRLFGGSFPKQAVKQCGFF